MAIGSALQSHQFGSCMREADCFLMFAVASSHWCGHFFPSRSWEATRVVSSSLLVFNLHHYSSKFRVSVDFLCWTIQDTDGFTDWSLFVFVLVSLVVCSSSFISIISYLWLIILNCWTAARLISGSIKRIRILMFTCLICLEKVNFKL